MNIHSLIDNLAVSTGALLMPKYFREGHESVTIAEHLNNISMIFPTAKIDRPANLAMDDAYLYSTYSKAVARSAKENPSAIKEVLNFEKDFSKIDNSNVFPLLAVHDTLIRYEQQKASYGNLSVDSISKGHTTGALAYKVLREHIFKPLQKQV